MNAVTRLLIDAGNTRLKWRLERAGEALETGTVVYRDNPDWSQHAVPLASVDAIWIGSVAGATIDGQLQRWLASTARRDPQFVEVERERLGLRVAYADTTRLGVDRYLAMLGARTHAVRALCVVDVGTAMTLDAVDADGRHFGGLIAPGPRTMIDSLLQGTARIADASAQPPLTPFARDTSDAVTGGAIYACAALVDRFVAAFDNETTEPVTLFLTGGAAARIAPRLRTISVDAPDLVFDGLRALADAEAQ